MLDYARLDLEFDIKPAYQLLLQEADERLFSGQLANDRSLYMNDQQGSTGSNLIGVRRSV